MSDLVRKDLAEYAPASNLAFNEKINDLIKSGRSVYHFAFGQSPFPVIDQAVQSLKRHAGANAYLPVAGLLQLRKAICEFHQRYDLLPDLDPEMVIVGPGSKELIYLVMHVFNGDVVMISPSWTTYKPQARLAHHTPYIIETSLEGEWKITPAIIDQFMEANTLKNNRLLIFNNPDNPTGTSYTIKELQELSASFRKHNIVVLSDEIYSRTRYDQTHTSLVKYYPEGTIISTGLSKWASAGGWRLGYHIYPTQLSSLKDAVRSAASHTYTSAASPVQYAFTETLQNFEACDDYMKHTSRIMLAVSTYCYRELASVGVKAVKPTAGYYIFPDFGCIKEGLRKRGITTCEQMCKAMLDECNVAVMAGGPAFLRPIDELTTRLCFVPFNGGEALKKSQEIGLNNRLPDNFVKELCGPVFDGIQALKKWVLNQQNLVRG